MKYCDKFTGQCPCLPNVIGSRCDECAKNHWKIASGEGCEHCNCDEIGALNEQCNPVRILNRKILLYSNFYDNFFLFSILVNVVADQDLAAELAINVKPISGEIRMSNAKVNFITFRY